MHTKKIMYTQGPTSRRYHLVSQKIPNKKHLLLGVIRNDFLTRFRMLAYAVTF